MDSLRLAIALVKIMMMLTRAVMMLVINVRIMINLFQFEGQNNTILRARSGENVTLDCVVFLRQDTTVTIFVFLNLICIWREGLCDNDNYIGQDYDKIFGV